MPYQTIQLRVGNKLSLKSFEYVISERRDLARLRTGIPADPSREVCDHNRKLTSAHRLAKRPRLPRLVQRANRLKAIAKSREARASHRKAIEKELGPAPIVIEG